MKKIILLLIVITSMISCNEYNPDGSYKTDVSGGDFNVVKIDSCEYIQQFYKLAHKGNCKYCAELRKQELKELIKELKKK